MYTYYKQKINNLCENLFIFQLLNYNIIMYRFFIIEMPWKKNEKKKQIILMLLS